MWRRGPSRRKYTAKPLRQLRVACKIAGLTDGPSQSALVAQKHHQFFAARYRGVQKIAAQERVVLKVHRNHHRFVFAALRFVDADGVGELQLIQLVAVVDDLAVVVEPDGEHALFLIDADDDPDIAVPDVALIVVAHLHDLVPHPKATPRPAQLPAGLRARGARLVLLTGYVFCLLGFLTMLLLGMLAFYVDSAVGLFYAWMGLYTLFSGYLMPLSLFPLWLRRVSDVLPFRYMLDAPVKMLLGWPTEGGARDTALGRGQALTSLCIEYAYVAVLALLVVLLWRRGLRRFAAFGA